MTADGKWLCPTDQDRARLLDNSARIRKARLIGAAAIGVAAAVSAPWLGWWLLVVFGAAAVQLLTLDFRIRRAARPELTVAFSLLFTEVAIGVAVALSGGATSPALPWMAVPIGMTAARFRPAVTRAALGVGAVITVVAALLGGVAALVADPWLLVTTLALEVNIVAVAAALQGAELQHRSEAILDPLTDLLNRSSLEARFAELREQASRNDATIALIALDLDGFKSVNDRHGHATGDVVLRDLSYEMRKTLRNFELFYRYGGEEFLVVLPGVEVDHATVVAERMRQAVERARPAGLSLTVSAGVAVARGEAVAFPELLAAADEAMYDAKNRGRNRISVAGQVTLSLVPGDRRSLVPA
jgi:diguanylate cyclase (GGDEF)-like protein